MALDPFKLCLYFQSFALLDLVENGFYKIFVLDSFSRRRFPTVSPPIDVP